MAMTSVAPRRPLDAVEAAAAAGRWPDFFILGAYKCGTTWAYEALRRHPQVYLDAKEINFFNRFDGRDPYEERGPAWYRRRFAAARGEQAVGDVSPGYLVDPLAAERIARHAPGARLVVLTRDPVERAHSHYWYVRRERPGFGSSLEALADGETDRFGVIESGFYARCVERYLEWFPPERMAAFDLVDIERAPRETFTRLCRFLEVDEAVRPATLETRVNPARLIRRPWLYWAARRTAATLDRYGFGTAARRAARATGATAAFARRLVEPAANPPLDPHLRRRLETLYADDQRRWRELLPRLEGGR